MVGETGILLWIGGSVTGMLALKFASQLQEAENTVNQVANGGALVAAVAGLLYVIRLVVSGTLVHRDSDRANTLLLEAIKANSAALDQNRELFNHLLLLVKDRDID